MKIQHAISRCYLLGVLALAACSADSGNSDDGVGGGGGSTASGGTSVAGTVTVDCASDEAADSGATFPDWVGYYQCYTLDEFDQPGGPATGTGQPTSCPYFLSIVLPNYGFETCTDRPACQGEHLEVNGEPLCC